MADALAFRAARHSLFPEAAGREIALEIFEGLAEYTGMRLAGYSDERVVAAVTRKRESETGLVRSFAYVSGPLYGFLLDGTGGEWRRRLSADTELGAMLAELLAIEAGSTGKGARRAAVYGGEALRAVEDKRERRRTERRRAWRASLIDGPVLIVDLNAVNSVTFDPGKVHPFGEKQTVYGTRELIAAWGVLSVRDGAILEDWNTGRGHVSLAGAAEDFSAGDGWILELADGWIVAPAGRARDFVVRKDRIDEREP